MDKRSNQAPWTPARIARLERLLADPRRLTAQQIANELGGISRNAIIGKAARLGLELPNRGHGRWRSCVRGRLQGLLAAPEAPKPTPSLAGGRSKASSQHIAFLDLEPHHCRWPYGDRLPFTFCGCDRIARSSYCAVHTGESHEQVEQADATPRGAQPAAAAIAHHGDEHARRPQRAA
jgi:hypothetical protein